MIVLILWRSDITEKKKKEEKPIEIIPDTNSTGIISSIRNQLQQKQEIIELTDTLSDIEEIEVLSNEDSLPLVSSEEYNAVWTCSGYHY